MTTVVEELIPCIFPLISMYAAQQYALKKGVWIVCLAHHIN